ncbi:hypothetical protein [Gimesia panareensis]|uniref:hypothetical protein n=1 Tax=Gimesia panareensis TaxID=2527978 RepID=UPI00118C6D44|nr:hypothetical protein [Gimesia panareensis]QDU49477.1 hypothetical protein Pan110_18140 [Gimesia panareensis]
MARIIGTIICTIVALAILLTCAAFGLLILLAIFLPPGDAAIPMGPQVDIPDSRYNLRLYGPISDGTYYYRLFADAPFQRYQSHTLGPLNIDVETVPTVEKENEGVYRITWGTGPDSPYTVIDVKHGQYVEDSNPDNARNEPFKSMEEYFRERYSSKTRSLFCDP